MQAKRITVHLHGRLRQIANTHPVIVYVHTPAEAIRALCVLIDGFESMIREGEFRLKTGREPLTLDMLGLRFGRARTLHIYPAVRGTATPLEWAIIGLSLVTTIIAITSIPSVDDYTQREPAERPNYLFNGAVNTTEQGGVVPLVFGGPIRIGSTVVSAGISSDRFSGSTSVSTASTLSYQNHQVGGAGGSRSQSYTPIEADNTLQTRATARIVDLLCEGEIRGLVNGMHSVYVDKTPVQNSDGTFNFNGLQMSFRPGQPVQDALAGIPDIENERTINQEIKHGTPISQTVSNTQADSTRVTIRFPRLTNTSSKGDINGTSVQLQIHVKPAGGSFTKVIDQTISDKNNSPADISYMIPLDGAAPWVVRVTRITADSTSDKLHNKTFFQSLTEITHVQQSYPYSCVMGIVASADQFNGQISKREYDIYGMIVDVPSNYDTVDRTYTGVWDGTFKRAWTDNGAWVLYHLLTDDRFGLGSEIPAEYVEATKWELYQIAQFNDQLVDDGNGGLEPRYRFSGVINKAADARKVLENVLSNYRSNLYYGGGTVVPIQDSPDEASAIVTQANVIKGKFSYSDLPMTDRYSAVAVSFNDPGDGYKLGIELVVDDDLVAKYGYRQTDKAAMFCTSRSQAHRLGKHLLIAQEFESDMLQYSTALEHAMVRPGQIIEQSDPNVAGARLGMRVAGYDSETATLTVDDAGGLDTSLQWAVDIVLPDGSIASEDVVAIIGNNLQLMAALSQAPEAWTICVAHSSTVGPKLWRVISVVEKDDLEFQFSVRAYHPDTYDSIEHGLNITTPDYSLIPTGDLAAPQTIAAEEYLYQDGVVVKSALVVSVTDSSDPRAHYTEFSIKGPNDPDYQKSDLVTSRTLDIKDTEIGVYDIRVRFVGLFNQLKSPWVTLLAPIAGKTARPSTPDALTATIRPNTGVVLSVTPIADLDLDHYRYYVGNSYGTAMRLAQVKSTEYVWTTAATGNHTFWCTAHDTSDHINGGSNPVSTDFTIIAPATPIVALSYDGDHMVLDWQDCVTDFAVAQYEIADSSKVLAMMSASTWRHRVDFIGSRTLTVKAVDIAGNISGLGSVIVSPVPPGKPTIKVRVIDNSGLFDYQAQAGSLPIRHYEVRKGNVYDIGMTPDIKSGNSSFTVIEEIQGGTYTYWWAAVDTAGNRGTPISSVVTVTQPPDYELLAEYSETESGWTGNVANMTTSSSGSMIAPVKTGQTWEQHFTTNGFNSPDDQISAGYEYYMQPSSNTASYSRVIDYGTLIMQSLVTLSMSPTVLDGEITKTMNLGYSADGVNWIDAPNQEQVMASSFRYVRYSVDIKAAGGDDLVEINDIKVKLDVKYSTDSGQATASKLNTSGTWVAFNRRFIDARQPTITAGGSAAVIGVADYQDAPNPTGFSVYLYDTNGQRVSGNFAWSTDGLLAQ